MFYISIEAMVEMLLAELYMRDSKHVIWTQDSFDWSDYQLLGSVDPYYRISRFRFLINRFIFGLAYRKADLVLTQARYYIDKLRRLYGIDPRRVTYLPNLVNVPSEDRIRKSSEPMVCYLAKRTHKRGTGYSSN